MEWPPQIKQTPSEHLDNLSRNVGYEVVESYFMLIEGIIAEQENVLIYVLGADDERVKEMKQIAEEYKVPWIIHLREFFLTLQGAVESGCMRNIGFSKRLEEKRKELQIFGLLD